MKDTVLVLVKFPPARDKGFASTLMAAFGKESSRAPRGWDFQFDSVDRFTLFRELWLSNDFDSDLLYVRWDRTYTQRELSRAPLLLLTVSSAPKGLGGPAYGTKYDFSRACVLCGTGARQTSNLILNPPELQRHGDVTETLDGEVLISAALAERLGAAGFEGLEIRPVGSARPSLPVPWLQVVATFDLPPMSGDRRGLVTEGQCQLCRRNGFFGTPAEPKQIVYSTADIRPGSIPDFARTWECFGNSVLIEPLSESRLASPMFLIKPRVFELFRELRIRGLRFVPVAFV